MAIRGKRNGANQRGCHSTSWRGCDVVCKGGDEARANETCQNRQLGASCASHGQEQANKYQASTEQGRRWRDLARKSQANSDAPISSPRNAVDTTEAGRSVGSS